jgi:hypothetical protein
MVLEHVLKQTEGFLFQDTALTNIGEITATRTIRDVHNADDQDEAGAPAVGSPEEKLVREYYALSESLTGTFFDILVSLAARFLDGLDLALVDEFEREMIAGDPQPTTRAPLESAVRALYRQSGPAPFMQAVRQASTALGAILGEYLRNAGAIDPFHFSIDELRAKLVQAGGRRIAAAPASPLARVGPGALDRSIGRSFARRDLAAR